ncbi:AmmeMemoRadiSam system protein B [Desulfogranum mediterraneum]|uniref:AmmeMemoRadiSam system protein B n=1 Tax=Desulfogranum mediterraneum TaxID=160661 RepID=UPI0003FCC0FF|nr:AmmeMemoRadiSam system protein B [Desulfogranum mediterraneum]
MLRQPAAADRFYPGDPARLEQALGQLIPQVPEKVRRPAKAIILPHAGYVYSGATAGLTVAQVTVPESVVILGPNHYGQGAELALSAADWSMPLGEVPRDRPLSERLLAASSAIVSDDLAHEREHSLEVQVPFLQAQQPDLRLVALAVSQVSYGLCRQVGQELAKAIQDHGEPVLMVASTDMTHYKPRAQASEQDRLAIERMLAFDPEGLYRVVGERGITMCGVLPTTIVLLAAKELGASKVELVHYTDSGEVSGDTDQVVGYAGLIVS